MKKWQSVVSSSKTTVIGKIFGGRDRSSFGRLDFQIKVSDMFEAGQVIDNHTYYHIGPDAEPDAIMALDNAYTLAPSLWKKTEMTSSKLLAWSHRIGNRYRAADIYFEAVILDADGNKLGFWYSYLKWTPIKRDKGSNRVTIYTPDTTKNFK